MLPTTLFALAADKITVEVTRTDWSHDATGTLRNGEGSLVAGVYEIMHN